MISACVLGCAGTVLEAGEAAFFRDVRPWGFILFARNIDHPEQVRSLVRALRDCVGRADAPVFIDQEGGRVARLSRAHWRRYPPAAAFAALEGRDFEARRGLARLGARLMAHDLADLGVDVDCAPVLDVPAPGAHGVIGDRAYGEAPGVVAAFGRAVAEGLIAGRVLPVIKHIPGHGRAMADSHEALPVVTASLSALETDFAPFRTLSDMPIAMTAHVIYAAIDPERPATTSPVVIERVIRGDIGFSGLLVGDDLSMKALSGTLADRARAAQAAGCDIVLHCNGDAAEMRAVAEAVAPLEGEAAGRAAAALARLPRAAEPLDLAAAVAAFEAAFPPPA